MNQHTRRMTEELVSAALEKSAEHVRMSRGSEKVASNAEPSDSYSTDLAEKLASAVEEVTEHLKSANAVSNAAGSVGGAIRSGAANLASKAVGKSGLDDRVIAATGNAMGKMTDKQLGAAALGGGAALAAGTAGGAALASREKRAADEKLASFLEKAKGMSGKAKDAVKGIGDVLSGAKVDEAKRRAAKAVDTHAKNMKSQVPRIGEAAGKAQAARNQQVTHNLNSFVTRMGNEAAHEKKRTNIGRAVAAGVGAAGVAGAAGTAKSMSGKKEASDKVAYSAPVGEGESPKYCPPGSAPQPTVTDSTQQPPSTKVPVRFPTKESVESFSNRSTLPERRAEVQRYFKAQMSDRHEVPQFNHKTATASDEAVAVLRRLAGEVK